jgi:hypothetical protein
MTPLPIECIRRRPSGRIETARGGTTALEATVASKEGAIVAVETKGAEVAEDSEAGLTSRARINVVL